MFHWQAQAPFASISERISSKHGRVLNAHTELPGLPVLADFRGDFVARTDNQLRIALDGERTGIPLGTAQEAFDLPRQGLIVQFGEKVPQVARAMPVLNGLLCLVTINLPHVLRDWTRPQLKAYALLKGNAMRFPALDLRATKSLSPHFSKWARI